MSELRRIEKTINALYIILILTFVSMLIYLSIHPSILNIGKKELINISPYFLTGNFALIVIFLVFSFDKIREGLLKIERKTWIRLFIVLIIGFLLREFLIPHTHRVFFDEDLYLGVANSIATEFRNILCNYGTPTHCYDGILNKDPSGFPFLAAVLFKLFGPNEVMIFQLSVVIGTLSILLFFFFIYFISNNERLSLISASLFSITPVHIIWSGSVATEIYFTFFALLSLSMMALFIRNNDYNIFLLSLASATYAAQIRPEGILFILVVGLFFLFTRKNLMRDLKSPKIWLGLFFVVVLLFSQFTQLYLFRGEDWGAPKGKKFGFDIFEQNLKENVLFWIDGRMYSPIFTAFALLGFIILLRKKFKLAIFSLVWWFVYFILFTSFYAGSVMSGGIGSRYVVMYFMPCILLSAVGIDFILEKTQKIKLIPPIIFFLLILSLYPSLPYITKADRQAQYARDMHDFIMSKMDMINSSCWVLTHNPSIFLVQGKNSLQTWFGSNKRVMDRLFNESGCIYYLEGAWCLFEPHKSTVCKYMHDNYKLEIVARYVREESPNHVFTLYRVYKKY